MQHEMTIVIPAAGMGRRMRSYGPKALIEVAHKQTVLSRQLRILKAGFPHADIIVVVGFEAERVARTLPDGVRLVENENYDETNVARSVEMGLRASSCSNALVVYGDLVFNAASLDGFSLGESSVLVDTRGQLRDLEVGCAVQNGVVTNFSYGLPTKWGQMVMLSGKELALFRRAASGAAKRRLFGFEVLNEVIDRGGVFVALEPPKMRLVEIDTSRDIADACRIPCLER